MTQTTSTEIGMMLTTLEREPKAFRLVSISLAVFIFLTIPFAAFAGMVIVLFLESSFRRAGMPFAIVGIAGFLAFSIGLVIRLRSFAKQVRQANYSACPHCLFDLSGLVEPECCPECAFDVRYLDLPVAWKALFRHKCGPLVSRQDRY